MLIQKEQKMNIMSTKTVATDNKTENIDVFMVNSVHHENESFAQELTQCTDGSDMLKFKPFLNEIHIEQTINIKTPKMIETNSKTEKNDVFMVDSVHHESEYFPQEPTECNEELNMLKFIPFFYKN